MTPPGAPVPGRVGLRPGSWRSDLLRIVLRVTAALGTVVYVPSVFLGARTGLWGVVALDTVALVLVLVLALFERIPTVARGAGACLVFYMLGAGLLVYIGSISQIYLFGFSLLTALIVGVRWGLATVALNAVTLQVIGTIGIASPEMVVPRWSYDFASWLVITANFVCVDLSLVLALGAVIAALEHEQQKLTTLNGSLEQEIRERRRTEESLNESRALLRIAGRTARLGGWQIELSTMQIVWSDEVCEIHEVPPGFAPGRADALSFCAPEWHALLRESFGRCLQEGATFDVEVEIITARGRRLWIRVIGSALRDEAGAISHIHGSIQDITPQKLAAARHDALEEQLRQAQKMETIGSLAGGVAHDFNNLLTVILSYTQMLTSSLPESNPMRADIEEIQGAGVRAVALTRQLLAFSRRQVLAPRLVDLAEIVASMENMLQRLIGEDIALVTSGSPGAGTVLVDPGQIEQVILNLAVNARDAMPVGGALRIETAVVALDAIYASDHVGVTPGPHMMLSVRDEGTGMDRATQARIFEPFFTTKEKGKGTGLGLATVFGVVQQSGGTIWVDSAPGQGTTFKLYFPLADGVIVPAAAPSLERMTLSGTETILLVEDEQSVRALARTILQQRGYQVLEAQSGGDALLLCEQHPEAIDLLLTDVVMPRMSGRQLAERLHPLRPGMKVLYMSGYTDDAVVRHGIRDATVAFLHKPFTPDPLLRKVREVLDSPVPPVTAA